MNPDPALAGKGKTGVPDPWHLVRYGSESFITYPDPALFVSDSQDANKKSFFSNLPCSLVSGGIFTSFLNEKSLWSHETAENQVFLHFLHVFKKSEEVKKIVEIKLFLTFLLPIDGTILICTNNDGSCFRRLKNRRIRIRNTGKNFLFSTCFKQNNMIVYHVG